jgi:hypothetical protein
MSREMVDRQSLLALVKETLSKFPPGKDSDIARSFRLISVDYLEGRITHPQFGLLYREEKTAEKITDGILDILQKQVRTPVNGERTSEAPPRKWHL